MRECRPDQSWALRFANSKLCPVLQGFRGAGVLEMVLGDEPEQRWASTLPRLSQGRRLYRRLAADMEHVQSGRRGERGVGVESERGGRQLAILSRRPIRRLDRGGQLRQAASGRRGVPPLVQQFLCSMGAAQQTTDGRRDGGHGGGSVSIYSQYWTDRP